MVMEVRFEDVDGDGDREVVVENRWLSAVLRFPETLGYAFYKGRFTWGGRLQSLEYKPTGRAFVLPKMIDMEGINPFGLPDELFANFPFIAAGGGQRNLKMGVGVFSEQGGEAGFESLPWTWRSEADEGGENVVAFRQEPPRGAGAVKNSLTVHMVPRASPRQPPPEMCGKWIFVPRPDQATWVRRTWWAGLG